MQLAEVFGWGTLHVERAQLRGRWMTPTTGTMGKGFPDLFICRDDVSMFIELKTDKKYPTPQQRAVHDALRAAGHRVEIWKPKDWETIEKALR